MMEHEDYSDKKYLTRLERSNELRWQFRYERKDIYESKNFSDSIYGSKYLSYLAAKKYRDEFLEAANELGLTTIQSSRFQFPLLLTLSPRNTSGIVGVSRSERPARKSRVAEICWVANHQNEFGKNKQRRFNITTLGEKSALLNAIIFRRNYIIDVLKKVESPESIEKIKKHVSEINYLIEYIETLEDDADVFFFISTINNDNISSTMKQDILNIRIGQHRFRKNVLDYWNNRCSVTGASSFIYASHIKPWRISSNKERLDTYNGLALSPVYDKAFDAGLISFNGEGNILISQGLKDDAELLGISGDECIKGLNFHHFKYLDYHQKHIFKPI